MSTSTRPRERGIAFCPELVQAIADGRKTITRRPIKWQLRPEFPNWNLKASALELGHYFTDAPEFGWVLRSRGAGGCWNDRTMPAKCPYGQVGDLLWVKERVTIVGRSADGFVAKYADGSSRGVADSQFDFRVPEVGRTFGQAFPKILVRTWLEIVEVGAERLFRIDHEEAEAEGVELLRHEAYFRDGERRLKPIWRDYSGRPEGTLDPVCSFYTLWNSFYRGTDAAWQNNPSVWRIKFKLHERSFVP